MRFTEGGVTAAKGFEAAGAEAQIIKTEWIWRLYTARFPA